MAYDTDLANKVRTYLSAKENIIIEEKKTFGGLAFLINNKMCINVSGETLMCRFDPDLTQELALKKGYIPMIMKGRQYKGYCYVTPNGYEDPKDFEFWMESCLDYNKTAKSIKSKKK